MKEISTSLIFILSWFVISISCVNASTLFQGPRFDDFLLENRSDSLIAELSPKRIKVKLDAEINVSITLINRNRSALRYLSNFGIGRFESRNRTWYLEIRKDNSAYERWKSWGYAPNYMDRVDSMFSALPTGASVTFTDEINMCYHLYEMGKYRIRAIYDPVPLPQFGVHRIPPVYSNWITVIVE